MNPNTSKWEKISPHYGTRPTSSRTRRQFAWGIAAHISTNASIDVKLSTFCDYIHKQDWQEETRHSSSTRQSTEQSSVLSGQGENASKTTYPDLCPGRPFFLFWWMLMSESDDPRRLRMLKSCRLVSRMLLLSARLQELPTSETLSDTSGVPLLPASVPQ